MQCIHCGMCLPSCPTYALTGRERSSPRGRIRLIRAVADGALPLDGDFRDEMYFCLNCRACETACPAGVQYGQLVEAARIEIESREASSGKKPALKQVLLQRVFARPERLRRLARLLRLYQRSGVERAVNALRLPRLLSKKLMALAPMAPRISPQFTFDLLPEVVPAVGERKYRVALLVGCVQDLAFANVNADTAFVLARNGCEVHVPRGQACCGSLHAHTGDLDTAVALLRRNLAVFDRDEFDAVIVNAAGCGSFWRELEHFRTHTTSFTEVERAALGRLAQKTRDVNAFLAEVELEAPRAALNLTVTYHDACHLAHAQKVRQAPRILLQSIPGLRFVELAESDWCCGSAGVYNITHTATALELLQRKVEHIAATGAEVVACANPGCSIQLAYGLRRQGLDVRVEHPISLLRQAYALG